MQSKSFFTPEGDYYLACNSVLKGATSNTQQYGSLLRIKKGETDFDKSYKGYNYPKGKIVTVDYLGNEKALLYIQDPEYTKAKGWGEDYKQEPSGGRSHRHGRHYSGQISGYD